MRLFGENPMKKYDDLAKIAELRERGVLSEEEFQREKNKILQSEGSSFRQVFQPPGSELPLGWDENTYCMVMHLSQFLVAVLGPFGLVAPILLWFLGREKSNWIDKQGRVIFNWWISLLIYMTISAALCFLWIGLPLVLACFVCAIVFPIVCAVKASEGIIWTYPMSIDFFGVGRPETESTRARRSASQSAAPESGQTKDVETHFKSNKYDSTNFKDKYS